MSWIRTAPLVGEKIDVIEKAKQMKEMMKASMSQDTNTMDSSLIRGFFSFLTLGVQQILLASVIPLATLFPCYAPVDPGGA